MWCVGGFIEVFTITIAAILSIITIHTRRIEFATSTPSAITIKRSFRLICGVGTAKGGLEVTSFGKFRVVTNPFGSADDDIRVIGNGVISSGSIDAACALLTRDRNAFALPTTAVIMSNGACRSGTIRVGILPRSRTSPRKRKGHRRSRNSIPASSSVATRGLFIHTVIDGAGICRRRTFVISCGVCSHISLRSVTRPRFPSFGKYLVRRVSVRAAVRHRSCGKGGCGA